MTKLKKIAASIGLMLVALVTCQSQESDRTNDLLTQIQQKGVVVQEKTPDVKSKIIKTTLNDIENQKNLGWTRVYIKWTKKL